MKISLSVGHGLYVRGASGLIDEVNESIKVVDAVANWLTTNGHQVKTFFDETSTDQSTNLNTIVNWHNANRSDIAVSVHFNAYVPTEGGRGTECLCCTGNATTLDISKRVAAAIAAASGLINRGGKERSDLYVLNGTLDPCILIETCFVDAAADVEAYQQHFDAITEAIAAVAPNPDAIDMEVLNVIGKISHFGGPDDTGVSSSEDLAWFETWDQVEAADKEHLFLDAQPDGTTGLARRLDPDGAYYVACRWDYDQFPKERLAGSELALIRSPRTGKKVLAAPIDWGPHTDTGKSVDASPAVLKQLGDVATGEEVELTYPFTESDEEDQDAPD
jgi:hypothetical protein